MILIVDHYDSFTYNLVQLVERLGRATLVVRSDALPVEDLVGMEPDAVILSPGPGRPEDAGVFLDLLDRIAPATPVLGVCLGHQALGVAGGTAVVRAEPVHGHASAVLHDGRGILAGVPTPFAAARYHSLVLREGDLSPDLVVTARTEDGTVMALEHRSLPRFGLQFHPESILTPEGPRIVENFLALAPGGAGRRTA